MHPRAYAKDTPGKAAYVMAGSLETVTYQQLEERANQGAHLFRRLGLSAGDCIAIFMDNTARFLEICWAAQRAGLYYACISSRLTAAEVDYIIGDCGAKVFITSKALEPVARNMVALMPNVSTRLSVGGAIDGYNAYETLRDGEPVTPIADETAGADMLYSSGTTGRPKGIKVPLTGEPIDAPNPLLALTQFLYGFNQDTVYLSPAPLYHAAPLRYCMAVQRLGGTVVVMEKFEAEDALRLIERHRITHSQWVPTMFVKMLKLPEDVRTSFDVSSLSVAIHAAAPCPVEIKQQMLDWWGPVIYEYYAGTEGNGFCAISPEEWLERPGSVGKALLGEIHILDEDGTEQPPGEPGTIFFANGPVFEYHNSPDKTAESRNASGWSTLGDIGYVDEDGYLFLTDRKAHMIISGGVNIYPQEVENLLITHPKVADVAVFGVPNEEFGEEVKAVVQPMDMADVGPELEQELIAFCRAALSAIKCPRSVDFLEELPRHPTGKLYKRLLRDQYWGNRDSRIV